MKSIPAVMLITAFAVAGGGMSAQGTRPGEQNPTDRGGVFTLTGCLAHEDGEAGQPDRFMLTDATTATGEGRAISAMGVGTPLGTQGDDLVTPPSDPPDIIVGDEFRVVPAEDVALSEHVGKKVQLRGRLAESIDGVALAASKPSTSETEQRGDPDNEASSSEPSVFMATSVDTVPGDCSQ